MRRRDLLAGSGNGDLRPCWDDLKDLSATFSLFRVAQVTSHALTTKVSLKTLATVGPVFELLWKTRA